MPLPPWGSLDSGEDGAGMGWVTDWSAQAACRTTDPDELFVQGAAQNRAKAVCTGCPVRTECLADALDNRVEFGVWGGMTERERRALLRRRPTVTSWRRLLETARTEYERGAGVVALGEDEVYESYAAVGCRTRTLGGSSVPAFRPGRGGGRGRGLWPTAQAVATAQTAQTVPVVQAARVVQRPVDVVDRRGRPA